MSSTPTKIPDSREEQDAARNPSQKNYEDTFNELTNGYKSTADELKELEDYANDPTNGTGSVEGIDAAEKYANDPANNIRDTKDREETTGWQNNYTGSKQSNQSKGGKFKSAMKKGGPFGIVGILLSLLGFGGFLGTSLFPVSIVEPFVNDLNDVNSSQQRHSTHLFGLKSGKNLQKKLSFCSGPVNIRCKFNTLDEKTAQKFKDYKDPDTGKGFSFLDETKKGSRVAFSGMKFPDGTEVHDVAELNRHINTSVKAASALSAVNSLRNRIFVVGKFIGGALSRLGLTKAKKISGDTKEQADKSYEAATKNGPNDSGELTTKSEDGKAADNASQAEKDTIASKNSAGSELSDTINNAIKDGKKLTSVKVKLSNALAFPQLLCLSYNMVNVINIGAKTIKAARLANFAMIFLVLASSIRAGKAKDAEVQKGMSVVSPSTYPAKIEDPNDSSKMIDNPNVGKNFTDAEAYKVVAYGDSINLSDIAKRLFVGGGILGIMDKIMSWIKHNIGTETMKTTCKIANSTVANIIGFLAAPVFAIASEVFTNIFPVDKWIAGLVNMAIEAAAGADLTTSLIGVDAGNAFFIGMASIMGMVSMKYGLKPGKLSAIKANMSMNNDLIQQDVAIQKYNAKSTPFAITNRYSLLGSFAYGVAQYMPAQGDSPLVSIGKLFSAIPSSIASLTKTAGAAYSMPVANYPDSRFQQCDDAVYNDMKQYFDTDMGCTVRYVGPTHTAEPDAVVDYMISKGQVDEQSGEPKSGSEYEKWIKYCRDRTDPWGSSSVALEDQQDDTRWYTGEKCFDDSPDHQYDMFSEYNGYNITNDNIDESDTSDANTTSFLFDSDTQTTTNNSALANILHTLTLGWAR